MVAFSNYPPTLFFFIVVNLEFLLPLSPKHATERKNKRRRKKRRRRRRKSGYGRVGQGSRGAGIPSPDPAVPHQFVDRQIMSLVIC